MDYLLIINGLQKTGLCGTIVIRNERTDSRLCRTSAPRPYSQVGVKRTNVRSKCNTALWGARCVLTLLFTSVEIWPLKQNVSARTGILRPPEAFWSRWGMIRNYSRGNGFISDSFTNFTGMRNNTVNSFVRMAGMLVIAAMLGAACSAVNPDESDPQGSDNGKSEKIPTPEMYEYPIPEAVDLGLSVKWASFNLLSPEPYSLKGHLAWGGFYNTTFNWSNYRLCQGSMKTLTRYNSNKENGRVDNKKEFKDYNYEDDAARAYLGGNWRIPTEAEWQELMDNCTWKWEHKYIPDPLQTGRNLELGGYRVTSKKNGADIFLPAAGQMRFNDQKISSEFQYAGSMGYYWSSTVSSGGRARCIWFHLTGIRLSFEPRCYGLTIRPVTD